MYAAQWYDRVVYSVAFIEAQYWGSPLHTISMILSTLQVMTFFFGKGFGYSYIIYEGTSNTSHQVLCQVNEIGTVL